MKYQPVLRPVTPALLGAAAVLASCTSTPLPPETAPRVAVAPQAAPAPAAPAPHVAA